MKQKIPSGRFCSPGIHYILFSLKAHQHYLTKNPKGAAAPF
ncbi:hypothetical protein QUW13_09225 [Enterococcus hirae]|nr:hypothetical protein [Enterococcus hirae]